MNRRTAVGVALALVATPACYHATIETGAPVGTEVIHKPWASSWVYGLVPPSTVSTAAQCGSGVSRVETQHSFVNQLVGFLTLGIYTPIEIKVTCAAGGSASADDTRPEFRVPAGAAEQDVVRVMGAAADRAVATGRTVFVQF